MPLPNGSDESALRLRIVQYFKELFTVSAQLQTLAEKELRQEEFNEQETLFLKSIVKRKFIDRGPGCGGPTIEELWDGWYTGLFYQKDDNPAVIADVHTNPSNDPASALYSPRVLHAATGPVVVEFLIVETDEGAAIYVDQPLLTLKWLRKEIADGRLNG